MRTPARCGASSRPRRAPKSALLPRPSHSILAVAARADGLSLEPGCSLLSSTPVRDLWPGPEVAIKLPAPQLPEPCLENGSRVGSTQQGHPVGILAQTGVILIHANTVRFRELDARLLLKGRPDFFYSARPKPRWMRSCGRREAAKGEPTIMPTTVVRLGGLAAVLVGVFALVTELLDLYLYTTTSGDSFGEVAASATFAVQGLLLTILAMLLLVALVGVYASQAEAAGVLGSVGFLVALTGTALLVGRAWDQTFLFPAIAQAAPAFMESDPTSLERAGSVLSLGLLVAGWLVFAVSTLRARIYPRAAAVLLLIGVVVGAVPLPLTTTVFGAAVAWMGVLLLTRIGAATGRSSRVR